MGEHASQARSATTPDINFDEQHACWVCKKGEGMPMMGKGVSICSSPLSNLLPNPTPTPTSIRDLRQIGWDNTIDSATGF